METEEAEHEEGEWNFEQGSGEGHIHSKDFQSVKSKASQKEQEERR